MTALIIVLIISLSLLLLTIVTLFSFASLGRAAETLLMGAAAAIALGGARLVRGGRRITGVVVVLRERSSPHRGRSGWQTGL